VFRRSRNLKFTSGLGIIARRTTVISSRNTPVAVSATIVAEFIQSRPLALIEGNIEEREAKAGIEKSAPARFGLTLFRLRKRLPGNAKVDKTIMRG
jgi:hypothetical protein